MINAKLLQLVIDASNDGIVVAEQEGDDNILIYANPAFERLTGYASEEILYQDCRFLQGSDRDQPGRCPGVCPRSLFGGDLDHRHGRAAR
jgi:PAS domain S-box-containing protein